jgi:hypothetical protein
MTASLSLNKITDNLELLVAVDNTRRTDTLKPEAQPLLDVVSDIATKRFDIALHYSACELREQPGNSIITRAAALAAQRQEERASKIDRRRQMRALDAEIARMSAELSGTAFAY